MLLGALIQEIRTLPVVTNWESFINFDGVVRNLTAGIKGLKHHIYNPELLCLLLQKLPQYQTMMWGQYVTEKNILEPTVIDFAEWVEQMAKYASCVNYTLAAGGMFSSRGQLKQTAAVTGKITGDRTAKNVRFVKEIAMMLCRVTSSRIRIRNADINWLLKISSAFAACVLTVDDVKEDNNVLWKAVIVTIMDCCIKERN